MRIETIEIRKYKTKNMHSFKGIKQTNDQAVARAKRNIAESETSRHCSVNFRPDGVIIHSAKQRSTMFISSAGSVLFARAWKAAGKSVARRDALVESVFS